MDVELKQHWRGRRTFKCNVKTRLDEHAAILLLAPLPRIVRTIRWRVFREPPDEVGDFHALVVRSVAEIGSVKGNGLMSCSGDSHTNEIATADYAIGRIELLDL
jgi:hypothetical protein